MPTSTDDRRSQSDRDRQPTSAPRGETRDFETQVGDDDRKYDVPFDEDLEPVEDSEINTHGSER